MPGLILSDEIHIKKHRLVYRIFETEVYVDVLSAYGHYNDK